MPLGVQQNNDFTQFTMDVWNDKIFYQEKEFPAGFMAMSILNIPEEDLPELIQAGGAPTFLFPVVVQGSDEEAAALFPQLRERILYLTELLWKYPPFCYNDYEKEMRRINILFDERNLLQIRTPDSEFQTEFLRFCVGIIRIPIAMYHFYAAGRFFELDYLRRLKKRNETHFAVAAHDCFNSEQFWDEMRSLQSLDKIVSGDSMALTSAGRDSRSRTARTRYSRSAGRPRHWCRGSCRGEYRTGRPR